MNAQEQQFYNSVTGFSPSAITGVIKRMGTAHKKSIELQVELGKELRTAKEWYGSEDGQSQMNDAGLTYNDICEFFQSVAGGRKKSICYKLIKACNNVDANENAVAEFVTACKDAEENGESPKKNIEAFNKFCSSGEAEVRESESEESESESESEEGSEDETKFSFSMKAVDGESGACIRLDESFNIIAEDGAWDEIIRAITKYLSTKGFAVTQND